MAIVAHDGEHVWLVRQPREAVDEPDLLEIPAGRLDVDGEEPLRTAQRELAEEIGLGARSWEPILSYYSSAGFTDERVHLFHATELHERSAESEENERIEIVRWPLGELEQAIAECRDAKTLIGLLWLARRLNDLIAAPRSRACMSEAEGHDRRRDRAPLARRPVGIEPLILDFLAYLELERGLSRNTLEAYRTDLLQFGEFLDRRGLSAAAGRPRRDRRVPVRARRGLRRPPACGGDHARQRKVACLRSFYRHLRREGAIEHDPTAELRGPRKPQRLPRVLSREEVNRLLDQPRGADPLALRDRALLELMYACGLRASEAVGLELADVDLEEGLLRARGKGSKERLVPIGRERAGGAAGYCRGARPRLLGERQQLAAVPQPPRLGPHAPGPLQDRPGPRAPRGPGRRR